MNTQKTDDVGQLIMSDKLSGEKCCRFYEDGYIKGYNKNCRENCIIELLDLDIAVFMSN